MATFTNLGLSPFWTDAGRAPAPYPKPEPEAGPSAADESPVDSVDRTTARRAAADKLLFVPSWAARRGPGLSPPPLLWVRPGPFVVGLFEDGRKTVAEHLDGLFQAIGLLRGDEEQWPRAERLGEDTPWVYRFRLARERFSWRIEASGRSLRVYRERRLFAEGTLTPEGIPSFAPLILPIEAEEHVLRLQRGLALVAGSQRGRAP